MLRVYVYTVGVLWGRGVTSSPSILKNSSFQFLLALPSHPLRFPSLQFPARKKIPAPSVTRRRRSELPSIPMADCKNQGLSGNAAGKNPQTKINLPSFFNRSMTVNSSAAAAPDSPYTAPAFQRNGSVKALQGSTLSSMVSAGNSFSGKVWKLRSIFDSPKCPSSAKNPQSPGSPTAVPKNAPDSLIRLPGTEDRVVIFFTSLRGIRRTFQDCHSIRLIFGGFRVNLDERDISMDVAYRKELQNVLGEKNVRLPQVFVKGKHVGGADTIKYMLEMGELARMVKGIPLRPMKPCDACDDIRFIPCANCSGSRKVFDEDEDQMRRCVECNENGLVRCPLCCMSECE